MNTKSFYGAIDPALALKVLKGAPTLKGAFTAGLQEFKAPPAQKQTKDKKQGENCTGYFGCNNLAIYQEQSGTLFCKVHTPKQVQTTVIPTDKPAVKKVPKK